MGIADQSRGRRTYSYFRTPPRPALATTVYGIDGVTVTGTADSIYISTTPGVTGVSAITNSTFNADSTGVSDSAAAFQAAVNALAGTGVALFVPAGSYLIDSTVTIPSDSTIIFAPGVFINGNIVGSYPLGGSIFRTGISGGTQGTTTLFVSPIPNLSTITVSNATGAVAGGFLYASNGLSAHRATHRIEHVSGNVLTLDRPMDSSFIQGDAVNFYNDSQVPQRIRIYGNGAHIRGKAVVTISFQSAWDCEVQDLIFDQGSSTNPSDACFGFNNACYNCVARRLHVDGYSGGSPSVAIAPESGDSCRFEYCTVTNCANSAFQFVESRNCTMLSCKAIACGGGFAWTNDITASRGSDRCSTIDCEAVGNAADGFGIGDASRYARIIGCRSNYNSGSGFFVNGAGGTFGTYVDGSAIGNLNGALCVTTGAIATQVGALIMEGNMNPNLNVTADCDIGSLVGTTPGVTGAQTIYHNGGRLSIASINVSHTSGSVAAYVIRSDSGHMSIGRGLILAGLAGDVCISPQGGTIVLGDVTCAAINGVGGVFGVYVPSGIAKVGHGFDATTCATPISNAGGTISMTQDEGVFTSAVNTGTETMTQVQAKTTVIQSSLSLSGNVTINTIAGVPGLRYVAFNNATLNGHTWSIGVVGGTAITVGTGKRAFLESDGTNMQRVTADT